MSFCKYGAEKRVGSGVYYICSNTNYPCKFARWCNSENKYKPNANFYSCSIRNRVEEPPVVEEPQRVVEELFDMGENPEIVERSQEAVIDELFEVEEQPKRRRKKRVVEEPEEILDEAE